MDIRTTCIEADCFYHIYNRGINGEIIFKTARNYQFFLNKIKENLVGVCDIYAYCLMPNHFHLLVKDEQSLKEITNFQGKDLRKVYILLKIYFQNNFRKYLTRIHKLLTKKTIVTAR